MHTLDRSTRIKYCVSAVLMTPMMAWVFFVEEVVSLKESIFLMLFTSAVYGLCAYVSAGSLSGLREYIKEHKNELASFMAFATILIILYIGMMGAVIYTLQSIWLSFS